jgi:Ca-activated chloride channel family protein
MAAIAAMSIAWANPQMGLKKEKVQQKSIDVFIALDVSQSMLAKDVSPNRLERAKQFCFKLIKVFKTDRIGIILFAGSAYLQMPLTTDYAAAQTFIKSANTEMVSEQGTNISKAIAMAEKSFEKNNQQHKALIILSDGENHEGAAIDAAENAAKKGMLIFTVGVGEETSVPIPLPYSHSSAYLEDKNGKMVRTVFNKEMLQEVARAAKGVYLGLYSDEEALKLLATNIQKIEKRAIEQRVFDEFETYYQYFVGLAILFLVLEFFIPIRVLKYEI